MAAWGAASLVDAAGVPAASASPSARLVYSRAEDARTCPDEAALRQAVARRFGYDPFFPWAERTVVVQVRRATGEGFVARLQVLDKDGVAQGTRELTSSQADCAEVFDATALAVSIALDATLPPPETKPEAAVAAPVASLAPPDSEPVPAPAPAPVPTREPPRLPPPNPPPPLPPLFFAGIEGTMSVGTAPSPSAGGALALGARRGFLSGALEGRVEAPAGTTVPGGTVTSWLYAASLVPCGHVAFASLCALGTLGSLQASGRASTSLSADTLFAGLGGRFGVEWGLTRALALRAHVDLLRNLAPAALVIDGAGWQAPPVAFSSGAGVAAHFP